MPSHPLHKRIILNGITEIDKIIDFPETYFDVKEDEIEEAVKSIYKRESIVDPKYLRLFCSKNFKIRPGRYVNIQGNNRLLQEKVRKTL